MHLTPIGEGNVLLEPGEGLDASDPDAYLVEMIDRLQQLSARRLIYDLKSIPLIDTLYYEWLLSVNSMCQIAGIEMVVVNIRPPVAYNLALMIKETPPFGCALDVDGAREGNYTSRADFSS
ncbi:STAS domain-containing protein [Candidatus Reidiella endopervernicosa]|nr:STAS domain-containing protein [Candidatus Reidiella endopervernicosa]